MTNAERLLLQDAIQTALEAERGRLRYKRALIIAIICICVLSGVIGGLLLWIGAY